MNVWMWWDSQQILQKDVTHSHNASNFINLMKSNSSCSISMPSQLHTNQGTHDKLFMTRHSKTDYFNKKMNQKQCLRLASFVPVPFIPFFVSLFPGTTASRLLDAWCVDRLGVSGSPDSVLLQILSDHKKNHLTNVGHKRCCQNANPHDIWLHSGNLI